VAVLPLIGISAPLMFSKKSKVKSISEFLIGFAFLFMGLDMISNYVPDLQSNPEMLSFLQKYASMGFGSVVIFLLVGLILTMIIQSSAATFAIVLIMCTKGWIDFPLACAVVLGSNIGTTITPILASMSGNIAAKRTAMGHLLFNVLGTVWCLAVFIPFADLNEWLTEQLGQGNPATLYSFVTDLSQSNPHDYNNLFNGGTLNDASLVPQVEKMQASVSFGLSLFHTTFNLVNVIIMIWLTNVYVKIVEKLVPAKHKKDEEEFSLKYISSGLLSASELNIAQAEKEMGLYAERIGRMIKMAQDLVHTKENSEEFTTLFSRIEKYEDISDRMEIEIANFLNRCAQGRLSNESKMHIAAMLNIISEIESIADSCFGVSKILIRKTESHASFTPEVYDNIDMMYKYVEEAMNMMVHMLRNVENVGERQIIDSYNKEREINNLRNQLRSANVPNINEHHYEYQAGIYYMDIINTLEKTGDYIINVVDTIRDHFQRKD
ncbi:MAG: Na/Pi symporter, partial [Muribaculaceae bacterium]|nr:Na/Pi symporter [Muribaculaceae bacterium]